MPHIQRYRDLQAYVGWKPEDAERVRSLGPLLAPSFPKLIDDFYAEIEMHPDAIRVITGGAEQIARLKQTLLNWVRELFSGEYDSTYVERRWRVGHRHVDIGLNQVFTNAALSRLRRGLLHELEQAWPGSHADLAEHRAALNLLLDLDLAIIEDAYQSEYQRRQATAERLATIGKVAGGVAHELRNPLNVVKTSVYFLFNSRNASEEKKRQHLERIDRQVGLADGVITALNDFARLPMPQLEPVNLESCLREVLEVTPLPPTIQAEWELPPEPCYALGDRAQLTIVFSNLVRNARDAMPQGGTLRFVVTQVENQAVICVQDTGPGISAEQQMHLFEPLYSTKAKGLGLGLSLSRDILEHHKGSISYQSEVGRGATFRIELPIANPHGRTKQ
jgi:signal transduction histidine kinase